MSVSIPQRNVLALDNGDSYAAAALSPAGAAALPTASAFAHDLRTGLRQARRSISPKYFYDEHGSRLFDRICELPEYYPTRTEIDILRGAAAEIAALAGPKAEIVEFGAGSLHKVRLLLNAMQDPVRYVPIDISGEHLVACAAALARDFPGLDVQPVVADYTQRLSLAARQPGAGARVGFFPGSTIGNFTPEEALRFLTLAADVLRGGALLLGADLIKDPAILHAAYNDSQGVTAAFNLNLLARANRELGTDFSVADFCHAAFYHAPQRRIEMHLVSMRSQQVCLNGERYRFDEGDTLHTENSHKFSVEGLRVLARRAGFTSGPVWTDPQRRFSVHWLQAPAA